MSDLRPIVDRELERVQLRPFTLDTFHRRRERKRRHQRIAAGVVGLAVALVALLFGTSIVRSGPVPAKPSPPISRNAQLTISTDAGIETVDLRTGALRALVPNLRVHGFAWSPDGTELAYMAGSPCALVIRNMETGLDRVVAKGCSGSRYITSLDWSADGSWIVFPVLSGERGVLSIELIRPDGTGERQLVDPTGFPIVGYSFSLSPDGSQIVFGSGQQLYTMNVDGSGRRFLANGMWPDWSSDGRTIAFFRDDAPLRHGHGDPYILQLWSIHPDGLGLTKLDAMNHCCIGGYVTGPVWSPDHTLLAAVMRNRLQLVGADGGVTPTIPSVTFSSGSLAWRP